MISSSWSENHLLCLNFLQPRDCACQACLMEFSKKYCSGCCSFLQDLCLYIQYIGLGNVCTCSGFSIRWHGKTQTSLTNPIPHLEEGNGHPPSILAWAFHMDRGAWWASSGSHKRVRHNWATDSQRTIYQWSSNPPQDLDLTTPRKSPGKSRA